MEYKKKKYVTRVHNLLVGIISPARIESSQVCTASMAAGNGASNR